MVCIKTPQGADSDDTMATTRDDTMGATLRGVLTKLSIPQWTNH